MLAQWEIESTGSTTRMWFSKNRNEGSSFLCMRLVHEKCGKSNDCIDGKWVAGKQINVVAEPDSAK